MSDEKEPMKIDIPVEEDEQPAKATSDAAGDAADQVDVVDELRNIGRQLAETLQTAWNSAERQKFESEVREGVRSFGDEVDKAIRQIRSGGAGQKLREEAAELREQVDTGELQRRAREGMTQGLRWLGEELSKLAEQFTPKEKGPDDVDNA